MKRKIIELGHKCMVMSLPIKWVSENNLKKGLELDVVAEGQKLVISPAERVKKPIEIELWIKDARESAARTILVNAYRAGYDRLAVHYSGNKKNLSEIVSKYLLGFELFSQADALYSIESVSEPSYENIYEIVNKMFFIITEILNDLTSDDIEENVIRVQRYDNFIKRCVSKKIVFIKSQLFMWQFLSNLVQIARQSYHLKKSIKKGFVFDRTQKIAVNKIQEMFSNLRKGYVNKDLNSLMDIHKMEQDIVYDKRESLLKSKNPVVGHYLMSIARLIYLANSPLTGVIDLEKTES